MATGPLCRTLPTTRLSFGGDELEPRRGDRRHHAALVDIREYADAVEPGILNALLYEAGEFIETQSFSILPRREAMRALELRRDQFIASDDVVAIQVAEMDVTLNELGDGQFCMGEYRSSRGKSVAMIDWNEATLEKMSSTAIRARLTRASMYIYCPCTHLQLENAGGICR